MFSFLSSLSGFTVLLNQCTTKTEKVYFREGESASAFILISEIQLDQNFPLEVENFPK